MFRTLLTTGVAALFTTIVPAQTATVISATPDDGVPGSPAVAVLSYWEVSPVRVRGGGSTGSGLGHASAQIEIVQSGQVTTIRGTGEATEVDGSGVDTFMSGTAVIRINLDVQFSISSINEAPLRITGIGGPIVGTRLVPGDYIVRFGTCNDGDGVCSSGWMSQLDSTITLAPLPPPIPRLLYPETVMPGTSNVEVIAICEGPGAFAPGTVTASFSGEGVAVHRVRRDSDTRLTLDVSVDRSAQLGMRSLTVTNANGQSLTSGPILGIGTFWGKNANDSFGQGAAGVGDVNGDGFDDVVVTAAGATVNGIIQAGVAYLYLGQPNGLASVPAWTYSGAQAYEKFGEDVRGLGDINHDGFADIAIGSDVETAADDTVGHGKVTIILGSISGLQPQPHVVLTDTVDPTDSRFGAREHTIAAGDFNGDGWIDLVIGAETFSNGAGQASEGAVHLYLSQGGNFASTPSRTWESNQGNSRLGRFLSMADVNRDGYADVIAAMHAFDVVPCAEPTNGCNQGRLVAYLGRPGSPPTTFAWNNSSPVQTLATLGYGVSAGDIDGDGFPEIAAGAPLWDQSNLPDCGTLVIYKGSQNLATTPLQTITGPFAGDRFGGSLAFVGDMDSDGFGELAVSAQAAEAGRGRVVVFRGSPTGLLPSPLMTFVGDVGAAWGQTLSAAGDVDGDSKPDWLIGSSDADTRGQSSGAVSIVLSSVNQLCDSIDFNNDTSLFDPQDIDAFLSVYSEGPCIPASATCNDIDFNNDGSLFDPCDIDAFLLVFSEGPCTLCGQ